jgi:predicted transcriptional regulator
MGSTNPQFNLRLDPELKAWLEKRAKELRLSKTWLANQAIREMMQREQQKTA